MVNSSDDSISENNVGDMVEKKKTNAEITRLASFPEFNPNPIVELDLECNVNYANPAAKALFPTIQTSASNHPFFADWEQSIKTLHSAKKGSFNREIKIGEHWFYQQINLVPKISRVRIYAIGIDDLKNTEKALKQSEERYHSLFSNMMDGFAFCKMIFDKENNPIDFVYLEINDAFEKITGLKRDLVMGKRVTEAIPGIKEANPELFGIYGRVALSRNSERFEIFFKPLSLWLSVSVYCPVKGYFAAVFEDITERKKAEQELWRAKNDWERTFDTVPDMIAILDKEHRIVRANKAMTQQLGVTAEQAIGENCYKCMHGTSLPPEFCPHAKTLKDGKEHVAEVHEPRLGGDFLVSTTPLKDEKGKIIGSVHVARNITERKKTEDALNKLNRHLRAIGNSNQALMHATDETALTQEVCNIIVHDCGYALVWVGMAEYDKNKTVRPVAFAGFDKEYMDQLNITWADKPRGRGPTGTVIRTGKPYVCRNMKIDPNFSPWREQASKRGYTASLVLPLFTFENETFGALNIYSCEPNPFTEEEIKLLTELANDFAYGVEILRLRKEKEQATESLRKQAELIDLSPDAIIVKKPDDTITFWSKGAQKLYGWTKEEAVGKQTYLLLRTKSPEPFGEITLKLKRAGIWSGQLIHHTKDNREVAVQSWWQSKLDAKGGIAEILESNVDMTERNRIQSKLEENACILEEYANQMEELANERAKQLNQAERLATIGQTAGMVGHDIRNPLQAIVGELYLAKDEMYSLPDNAAKKSVLESIICIEENLYYIDKIVADLQDYTKPLKPNKEKVNIEKIIEEALLIVAIPINLEVSIVVEEGFPQFMADFSMLKRVLMNLIQNAVQAMPNGGKLKVNAERQDKQVCISVADTGEGIPEEVQSKLFTPLFTTKSKGQGFGLAVVKRLVEAQDGKISFQSQNQKGTTFIIHLPIN
jgi:PAS domain S-box-containing protein